jgi:hypothetical protein
MAVRMSKNGINKSSTAPKGVIVFDAKDDETRKVEAKGIMDLSRIVRDPKYCVKRCILAIHDPSVSTFFNVPTNDSRKYAMIELYDSKNDIKNLNLKTTLLKGLLISHKYKVVATKVFKNEDYPVSKLIVSMQ